MNKLLLLPSTIFLKKLELFRKTGKIDDKKFQSAFNDYVQNSPHGKDLIKLNYTKDGRDIETFKNNMDVSTFIQNYLIKECALDMERRGHKLIYINNGVDNSGGLVEDRSRQGNPDYLISINDSPFQLYDVEQSYVWDKATFKVGKLEGCLKRNCNILLFIGTGLNRNENRDWNNLDITDLLPSPKYAFLGQKSIESLLTLKHLYGKEVGGKPSVMIGHRRTEKGMKSIPMEEIMEFYSFGGKNQYNGISDKFVDFGGE